MSKKNRGNRPPVADARGQSMLAEHAEGVPLETAPMVVTRVAGGDTAEGLGVGAVVGVEKSLIETFTPEESEAFHREYGAGPVSPNARLRLYLGAAMRLSAFVNGRQSSEFMTSELDLEPHEYTVDAIGYHVTTSPLGKTGLRLEGQRITFLIPWGRVNQAVVLA